MPEDVGYFDRINDTKPSLENGNQPQTWKDGIFAGLPHVMIAILFLVVTLITSVSKDSPRQKIFEIVTLIFVWVCVVILVISLIIAWRKRWPRWSASYYFYGFLAISAPTLLLIQNQLSVLPYFIYLFALTLWIFKVTQRDAIKGLLMITPVAILSWFPVLEFIPNNIRNPLQLGMFLITALAAISIVRFGNWRLGIWTILGSSLLVGLPISYFRTYHHNIPPEHADASTIAMLIGRFAGALMWSMMLIFTPLFVWVLWELSKRLGKDGRAGYRLVFIGLVLNLASNLLTDFWYLSLVKRYSLREMELLFSSMIALGAIMFIIGAVMLLMNTRLQGILSNDLNMVLLLIFALGLPLILMFPMFDRYQYTQTILPFGLFDKIKMADTLVYSLGSVFLFLGVWLITRLRVPDQSNSDVCVS